MIRRLTHPLLMTLLAVAGLYLLFGHLIEPPLPKSLLIQFMIFSVIGVLMVATFNDATYDRLLQPIRLLLGGPGAALLVLRGLAFVAVVGGSAYLAYGWVKPDLSAPIELRSVHPAPPSSLRIYGQTYDLVSLENPLRAEAPKGSAAYEEILAEGSELYYQNCVYCHGDHLDGQGHFAEAFNPRPANFQDVGTIAQLQESYLFWRITTGGPGLPREGAPWASAMPVWHEMLEEDEVWKIITFLYDYTGFEPRSWELATAGEPAATAEQPAAAEGEAPAGEAEIEAVYQKRCAQCHGEEGEGDGPAADYLYPKPRDFSLGVFKYKTTHADSEFPFDADLRQTIRDGLPATSMPAWKGVLTDQQIDGLIELIKVFGGWDGETEEDLGTMPIEMAAPVAADAESLAAGAKLFEKACVQCHGTDGRGNVTSGKKLKDDWEDRIWPRNLTRPETWRWTQDAADVFQRISAGIRGTPMPEHTTTMSEEDRWHVANYAMTLRDRAVPLSTGDTVVRAKRIEGALPSAPQDPAWAAAPANTFALVPNIIKDGRLFYSLNDRVTLRALFNDEALALLVAIDDRTYSVPGDEAELRYRHDEIEPTRDGLAVQFPAEIPETSEKPWFRHGDLDHPVNMWFWQAPSVEPETTESTLLLDAAGPDKAPVPREGDSALSGVGTWQDGQWRVVFTRPLETEDVRDLQFEVGRYIPIAVANWDGWAGDHGSRHSLSTWYWLLLEPPDRPEMVYGASGAAGLLAALVFLFAVRRQRSRFDNGSTPPPG